MHFKIAICDDIKIYLDEIEISLRNYNWKENTIQIYKYNSGNSILDEVKYDMVFDIVFLDIDLKDENLGTDIGRTIKSSCPDTLLIYISAYSRFYIELANAEPFHFLRKPISQKALDEVLDLAIQRLYFMKNNFYYPYKVNGLTKQINLAEAKYFWSIKRKIIVCGKNSMTEFYGKLDVVEQDVATIYPFFLRPNDRYLVNYKHIETLNNQFLIIGNVEINISRSYKDSFKKKLFSFVNNRQ